MGEIIKQHSNKASSVQNKNREDGCIPLFDSLGHNKLYKSLGLPPLPHSEHWSCPKQEKSKTQLLPNYSSSEPNLGIQEYLIIGFLLIFGFVFVSYLLLKLMKMLRGRHLVTKLVATLVVSCVFFKSTLRHNFSTEFIWRCYVILQAMFFIIMVGLSSDRVGSHWYLVFPIIEWDRPDQAQFWLGLFFYTACPFAIIRALDWVFDSK